VKSVRQILLIGSKGAAEAHMTRLGCDSCQNLSAGLPEVDVSGLEGGVAKAALA
jgi:hypothetical protein